MIIVGPCALESKEQILPIMEMAKRLHIDYFRAQIFKPRTSPDSFQGLGDEGVHLIRLIKEAGFKVVSECCSIQQLDLVFAESDVVQIGARNMQNFELLKSVGKSKKFNPKHHQVLLKRGFANTLSEWLLSAKYLEQSGVPTENIILCERGTRNFSSPHGVTLDLGLAYKAKLLSSYRVIADPSHGTKSADLVLPMAKASLHMGLDGIMVEVHPHPSESVSDAEQAISPEQFESFYKEYLACRH